jgi:hypothetical protein
VSVKSVRKLERFLISLYVLFENYCIDNLLSATILNILLQFEFNI